MLRGIISITMSYDHDETIKNQIRNNTYISDPCYYHLYAKGGPHSTHLPLITYKGSIYKLIDQPSSGKVNNHTLPLHI